jgi:carboxylesterase
VATPLRNAPYAHDGDPSRAVLLVHGLGGGPYELQRLGEALAARGYSTRGLVLPGHEAGPKRMPASTWPSWRRALADAYTELAARSATVHLVGFSTGATLALHHAIEDGLQGKLALLAPFVRVFRPRLAPMAPERAVRALAFVHEVPRRPPPLRDPEARRDVLACATFRTFNLDATRSALDLVDRTVEAAPRLRAPVLVIQGARDSVVDAAGARDLVARLPEPKRLAWMERSDHLLALDEERDEVARIVGDFLDA